MTRTVVRVENLVKEFGKLRAVDDLSFEIEQGEFFSIVGPSGCGKSTTLRCIAVFESPTEGTIHIRDTDVTEVPAYKRDTGHGFQSSVKRGTEIALDWTDRESLIVIPKRSSES